MPPVEFPRRRFVVGTSVASALWCAPAVITLDRVSAATGTCGTAPVQVDWSLVAANHQPPPATYTAADGTVVGFTSLASTSPGKHDFEVRTGNFGGLQDILMLDMDKGGASDYSQIQIDFDRPVTLCFTLAVVDQKQNSWEDTVSVVGTDGGTPVNLGLSDFFFFGTSTTYLGINTVRGVSEAQGGSNAGNVDVSYPAPVDRVVITYSDVTSWTKKQFVGIHDLRWC